jgi:hypothetical protein
VVPARGNPPTRRALDEFFTELGTLNQRNGGRLDRACSPTLAAGTTPSCQAWPTGPVLMHTEQPGVPRMNSRPSAPSSQAATGVAAALNVECCANGMKRVGFGDLCLTFATPYL